MSEEIKLQCLDCGHVDLAHKFPDISQDPDDPSYCEPYCPYCISTRISGTVRYEGYRPISYVSGKLEMQNQYVSYYLEGLGGYPNISQGIDWVMEQEGNYHSIWIKDEDVNAVISRIRTHRAEISMTWFCDECPEENCIFEQNQKPTANDCKEGLNPIWFAKRWLLYSKPNPDYEMWLEQYGTEKDKILWEQEKKDRGVE